MQTPRNTIIVVTAAFALSACSDSTGPNSALAPAPANATASAKQPGTGITLNDVTGLSLPLIGQVGQVSIDQAVITQFGVLQTAGNIVGIDATGVLQLTGGVLGTNVITQNFTTDAQILSTGKGQCSVVTVDLAPITLDALGSNVSVNIPAASVTPSASGAVGPLLCNLGSFLNAPVGQVTSAVRGIVNAINQIII